MSIGIKPPDGFVAGHRAGLRAAAWSCRQSLVRAAEVERLLADILRSDQVTDSHHERAAALGVSTKETAE